MQEQEMKQAAKEVADALKKEIPLLHTWKFKTYNKRIYRIKGKVSDFKFKIQFNKSILLLETVYRFKIVIGKTFWSYNYTTYSITNEEVMKKLKL